MATSGSGPTAARTRTPPSPLLPDRWAIAHVRVLESPLGERKVRQHIRALQALGYAVTLNPAA
jgi:hypothetical protein